MVISHSPSTATRQTGEPAGQLDLLQLRKKGTGKHHVLLFLNLLSPRRFFLSFSEKGV
jgi:hypothetical protein